jgi:hypothetical protein
MTAVAVLSALSCPICLCREKVVLKGVMHISRLIPLMRLIGPTSDVPFLNSVRHLAVAFHDHIVLRRFTGFLHQAPALRIHSNASNYECIINGSLHGTD